MGGFYWCLNLVLSQASCFVAAKLYLDNPKGSGDGPAGTEELDIGTAAEEVEGEGGGFPPSAVMAILEVASALWFVSVAGFFASINKDYIHTFFDVASGPQHVAREFLNATNDHGRSNVFLNHRSKFAAIEADIKEWMKENYEVFEAEKPEWWTELLISTIPDDFIPKEELKLLEEKGVGGKRKKSVVSLGGRVSLVEGRDEGVEEGVVAGLTRRLSVGGRRGSAATVAPATAT